MTTIRRAYDASVDSKSLIENRAKACCGNSSSLSPGKPGDLHVGDAWGRAAPPVVGWKLQTLLRAIVHPLVSEHLQSAARELRAIHQSNCKTISMLTCKTEQRITCSVRHLAHLISCKDPSIAILS